MPATDDHGTASVQAAQKVNIFDLRLLLRELWHWKWLILLVALIGATVGVNNARNFTPTYRAEMVVAPVSESGASASASGGRFLGAAQSLGLISGGSPEATSFDYFKQSLGGRELAGALQRKHELMQKIYKGNWDPTNNTWIKPKIDENSISWKIDRFFHLNSPKAPDIGNLASYVGGAVEVKNVENLPFISITVEHHDRDFALYLLETVYKEADELLHKRKTNERERNRIYVREQLTKTQLADIRAILLGMQMKLEQDAMLANAEPPYTIKILEHPWVESQPIEPQLVRIIAIPTIVGLVLILAVATMVVSYRME
jgi:hypothetical protein